MDKFLVFLKVTYLVELFLDKVLYRLHIMIGCLLDFLHTGGIRLCEMAIDIPQGLKKVMVEILQLWQRQLTKRNEVFYLHANSITYERIL